MTAKDKFLKCYNATQEGFRKCTMHFKRNRWILPAIALLLIVIAASLIWHYHSASDQRNIIQGNGRIEATEIDIASRIAGRIKDILVHEGDYVKAGQILVYMDTDVLDAQLKEAQGQLLQANDLVGVKQSLLEQKKSEKIVAEAQLKQSEVELEAAEKRAARSQRLVSKGAGSNQVADDDQAAYQRAIAAKEASQAQIEAANAGIVTAEEEIKGARSAIESTKGTVARMEADVKDSQLKAPRDGRVQYLIAHTGEVVAGGSPILSLVDLGDIYITFFLPTVYAGQISIGDEVRIVLDAVPNHVIPAHISFVSDTAQFTPKTVETHAEREKFMFRVKAQIPPELLEKCITEKCLTYVKPGMSGVVYIRLDATRPWPQHLQEDL